MIDKISNFSNQHSFLSNDHICLVHFEGLLYASVTHAFQAARISDPSLREELSKIHDIPHMYSIVENIEDPPNWSKIRVRVMEKLIRDKFRRNHILRQRLQETGSAVLQNSYPDNSNPSNTFWGTVNERGENQVGKILMKVRSDIERDSELENWLLQTFELITEVPEMPRIILHEYRNEERLRKVYLEDKRFYTIGTALDCDLKLSHDSIEAYHAVVLFDRTLGLVLIDLDSTVGTFINASRIRKSIPAPLEVDDWLTFGEKRKRFRVEIYVEHIRREYERRIREIEKELKTLENMQNPGNDLEKVKKELQVTKEKTVKIENLAKKTCSSEELSKIFEGLGEIEKIRVSSKKFEAFLQFSSQKAADSAVKWDGMTVQGRRLRISYYRERSRSR